MTGCEFCKGHLDEGGQIRAGEPPIDLVAEKVTVALEAPLSGWLEEIRVQEKEVVSVRAVKLMVEGEA